MQQWEYRLEKLPLIAAGTDKLEAESAALLNELGAEGWDVASMSLSDGWGAYVIFRRPKSD